MTSCLSRQSGDLTIYSSGDLSKEALEKILSDHKHRSLRIKELEGLESQETQCNGINDNFLSDIIRLKVRTSEEECLHIVGKEAMNFTSRIYRWIQSMSRPFYKECIWYRVARPLLSEDWPLVKELAPECYYGAVNTGIHLKLPTAFKYFGMLGFSLVAKAEKSLILLENVCEKPGNEKFERIDKIDVIQLDIALSAIRTMAHFHGIWWQFLHGDKGPREEHLTPQDFKNVFALKLSKMGMDTFIGRIVRLITVLLRNNHPDRGEELAQRYEAYSKSKKLKRLYAWLFFDPLTDNSRFQSMAHGDFWTNNLLYRPHDKFTLMIDFQVMQIAHPARDFWYFLYSCTDRAWREMYLDGAKDAYYDIMSAYIEETRRPSREEISAELDERRGFGLFVPFMTIMMTKYPEQIDKQQIILFGKDYDKVIEVISAKAKEDDHPQIKEMRRLFFDAIEEAADLGII